MPVIPVQVVERLPVPVNLAIYRGDDVGFTLVVTTSPDYSPYDLTGGTVRAQVRTATVPRAVAGEFTVEIDGNNVSLRLPAAVTATLPATGVWDCELTLDGWVTTLTAGTVTVTSDVTE